jgi:hypothetical protein
MQDNRPHILEKIDLNAPLDIRRVRLIADTDTVLQVRFTRGPHPENTTGATICLKLSGPNEWGQTIEGVDEDEASGKWRFEIPRSKLALVGEISGQVINTDQSGNSSGWQLYEITTVPRLPGGSSPAPGNAINWDVFTGFLNTATHGPTRAGTGLDSTTNPDGSETHSVKYGSTAGTALEGNGTAADADPAGPSLAEAFWAKANDGEVVKLAGNQEISDVKTFLGRVQVKTIPTLSAETEYLDLDGVACAKTRLSVAGAARSFVIEKIGNFTGNLFIRARNTGNPGDLVINDQGGKTTWHGNIETGVDNTQSFGTAALRWLAGYISTVYSSALRALTTSGLALHDSAGAEHALLTSNGIALSQLTASRPLLLDANKRITSPTAADFRGAIDLATVAQAEAEAGTATTTRAWTAERVKQAILALSPPTVPTTTTTSQSTSYSWQPARNGDVLKLTLTGAVALTFSDPATTTVPLHVTVEAIQDGTGGRVLTLAGNVSTPGAVQPTLSATANAVDLLQFVWTGAKWRWVNASYAQGNL